MPHMLRKRWDQPRIWASTDPPIILCPHDVATLFANEMEGLCQEQLRIVLLDTKNHVVGCEVIYQGTVHSVAIRPAEVLRPAVLTNAPSLIVVHNHPSGDPSPSVEDIHTTEALMAAGDLLDIAVLDHIVLGSGDRYVSLQERGLVSSHRNRANAA